ncbi:MAG TPA: SDR family oxidoreductase [Phycisphaerae bacterium]|nr:SDR family oxidoreductase [Phycisphaerae bacterium]HOM49980.1 SDR family oxidoreductase [Phycisphaerae bacterium]HON66225.1 SDR family oxidoreductase [Phycisphaerae bacterium]HOQ87432.1 SDR family oxidoreductase [Phycisphaerae bacterium]HPU26278.1 SDR family oxidoreductase [Phycisphaerae bacterium]
MTSEPTIQQLFDLSGKVALITGASGYLGQSMSRALAEAGASVVISSREQAKAQTLAAQLPVVGKAKHHGVRLDYFDEASIEQGVADAIAAAGRIDILVNNGYERVTADWTSVTGEQFTRQLANATGCFLLARAVYRHACQRGGGASIIMIGSMYGLVGSYPDAYEGICMASPVAYHALKGGVVNLTRHLAVYWAKDGVRVNTLSPGPFPATAVSSELKARLSSKSPMKRMGRPDELKGAVVFLASDASSYVTGHNLVVDGGWTAW